MVWLKNVPACIAGNGGMSEGVPDSLSFDGLYNNARVIRAEQCLFLVRRVKAKFLEQAAQAVLPGMFGMRAPVSRACNGKAGFRSFGIIGIKFDQFLDVPIAKDFLADLEHLSEFPVVGGQVAGTGGGAFDITALGICNPRRGQGVADTQVQLAAPKDVRRILDPTTVWPALTEDFRSDAVLAELVDQVPALGLPRADKSEGVAEVGVRRGVCKTGVRAEPLRKVADLRAAFPVPIHGCQ